MWLLFERFRKFILVLILSIIPVVLIFVQSRDERVQQAMTGPVIELSGYVEKGLLSITGAISDALYGYFFVAGRSNELLALRAKSFEMGSLHARIDELLAERESILELNFEKQHRGMGKAIYAKVIGRSGAPMARIVRIDRGRLDGVRPESPVIAHGGAVGQVINVSRHFSDVLLMTDASFAIDARVVGGDARGLLRGKTTASEYLMELRDIDGLATINVNEPVVTSGINSVFPGGIPIGEVSLTQKSPDGLNVTAYVKPFVKMEHLREVLILLERGNGQEQCSPITSWIAASP